MKNLKECRINVMVSNMEAAVSFYIETLELELINRYGNQYAEVKAPGLMIGLHPISKKVVKGNNLSIGFGVVNFDKTIEHLNAKGIDFKIEQDGYIRLAYFTDLDGNALFLAERKE
jgi:catechol 2,3-dioxygenase-like lactoylglutathione lyase family enzyme